MSESIIDKNGVLHPLTNKTAREAEEGPEVMRPIIVSLGKKKKKAIKRLKRGVGPTMDEVMDVVDQVQANLGADAADKILVPIVVVYRKKEKRYRGWF